MYEVILVDDEQWSIIDMKKSFPFESMGFQIIGTYQNPVEALISILNRKPNLVLTDIRMPNLTGIDLMRKIREYGLQTEIIVISGYSDFEFAKQAITYGAIGYCLKPIDTKEAIDLLFKVKKTLDLDKKKSSSHIPNPETTKSTVNVNFQLMVDYIDKNYNKKLSLNQLSEQFSLNPNYCCYLFEKHIGMTFSQYLTSRRIEQAKKLLRYSYYSLDEIAINVGFSDYSYFSKVFKKYTGISPSAYRKNKQR